MCFRQVYLMIVIITIDNLYKKQASVIIPTNWVEIMAPFYSSEVFFEAGKEL